MCVGRTRAPHLPFATTVRCVHKAGAGKQILSAGQQNPRQLSIVAKHPVDRKLPDVKPWAPKDRPCCTSDTLAFHRLFIAEAPKFPALAKHFIARNGLRDLIAGVLAGYVDRGALAPGDARVRAEHFTILVIVGRHRRPCLDVPADRNVDGAWDAGGPGCARPWSTPKPEFR
jgi:AefR-like transcriptional repressor, C-terminal domain